MVVAGVLQRCSAGRRTVLGLAVRDGRSNFRTRFVIKVCTLSARIHGSDGNLPVIRTFVRRTFMKYRTYALLMRPALLASCTCVSAQETLRCGSKIVRDRHDFGRSTRNICGKSVVYKSGRFTMCGLWQPGCGQDGNEHLDLQPGVRSKCGCSRVRRGQTDVYQVRQEIIDYRQSRSYLPTGTV